MNTDKIAQVEADFLGTTIFMDGVRFVSAFLGCSLASRLTHVPKDFGGAVRHLKGEDLCENS